MKPAYSSQFDSSQLQMVKPISLPAPITKDWAWEGATGSGVRVAVVDSGIDASHPSVGRVAGGVAIEYDAGETPQIVMKEGPHEDLFGHGTACAATIRMIAPDVELYSIRVLGSALSGKGTVFAAGLRWAIDTGMNVVNLSLSTRNRDYFDVLHELVDEAYFKNVMLVSAMNNNLVPSYPSEYSSVFSVAARERSDPLGFDYNPAPPVEFGAPGIDVEVAWTGGTTIRATGNSFAAPHISGHIARLLSKHPRLTPFQVKTVLHALADNATSGPATGTRAG